MIAESYCKHDLFDPYIVSASNGKECWAGSPKNFNWSILEGKTIVSHNRYFDNTVYNEMVTRGWAPQIKFVAWHCSANLTSYLCNRRALSHALEYLYKVKLSKDPRDTSDNKHWPADFTGDEQKAMLEYARRDAFWCWKLWEDFSSKWPEKEQRLSNLTIEQGMRGVQINTELLDQYIIQSHEMKLATEKLLPWLSDTEEESWEEFPDKPTSTKAIAEACRRAGIPCPPVKAHEGEEAYEEWEQTYKAKNSWIGSLTSWRSVNKLYKSFLTVKQRLRPDGTMPFALKYMGAHTGRFSGDAKINMQNMRKEPVLCTRAGLMETNEKTIDDALNAEVLPEWVKHSIDFRALVIPRPGKQMIVSDLSQIEPRALAWLAGDKQTLDFVLSGKSIYEAEARFSMGFTGEVLDKKSTTYAEAKARRLALGYGAGWLKFIQMSQLYTGMDLTADDPEFIIDEEGNKVSGYGKRSKEIVAAFRKQNPKITGLWASLELAFKRSTGSDFRVVLASGRVLRYEKVKCERRLKPDRDGKPKLSTVFTADIGGRRFEFYSGKLAENVTQAFSRDVFCDHLLALEDAGHTVLFSSHDEAILEVDPGVTAKDIEKIMSVCPDWCPGLPVAAEANIVKHYCKP